MPYLPSRELLERLLAGEILDAAGLDELIAQHPGEDQYLDYKDGKLLQDKEGAAKLRRHVSGLANAEGGVLVIGVNEDRPRGVSSCSPVGKASPQEWAASALGPLAGYLSPPPRVSTIRHAAGAVVVLAVQRAAQLVPNVKGGALVYHLRFGDRTLDVPEYLISDLLLGRRQRPILGVANLQATSRDAEARFGDPDTGVGASPHRVVLEISFSIENLSLVPAEEVQVGLATWSLGGGGGVSVRHLLQHVDASEPVGPLGVTQHDWQVANLQRNIGEWKRVIGPFDSASSRDLGPLVLPWPDPSIEVEAALFLVPRNMPPQWFQLTFQMDNRDRARDVGRLRSLTVTRIEGGRPRVAWRMPK